MESTVSKIEVFRGLTRPGLIAEGDGRITASPESIEEIAAVLARANGARLQVEIAGAGTKRGRCRGADADVLLDTKRLSGVTEHSWQDMTCTVRAGTPWTTMQRVLAEHRQQVAVDPLWPETATVGGVVATNDSGALRLRYGSLRDLIIGMTVVLADGTMARSGGKVVKNVAGYDLHKLMIGAFGTLGVIADVTFRLHPLPADTQQFTFESSDVKPMADVMMKILDSHLSTQAMQVRAGADGFALDVELACVPEVLRAQAEELHTLAVGCGLRDLGAETTNPFRAREDLFAREGGVILKVTMLPAQIGEVAAAVKRFGGIAMAQTVGIMFARFEEEKAAKDFSDLAMSLCSSGGWVRVLRAPESMAAPAVAREGNAWGLMQEIKKRFDPNGILNPGYGIGGI